MVGLLPLMQGVPWLGSQARCHGWHIGHILAVGHFSFICVGEPAELSVVRVCCLWGS